MDGITFSIAIVDPGAPTPTNGGADNEGGVPDDLFQALLAQVLAAGQVVPNLPMPVNALPVATEAADAVSAIDLGERLPAQLVRLRTPEGGTFEALIGRLPLPEQSGQQVFDVTEAVRVIAETANAAAAEPATPTPDSAPPVQRDAVAPAPAPTQGDAAPSAAANAVPAPAAAATKLPAGAKIVAAAAPNPGTGSAAATPTEQHSDAAAVVTSGTTTETRDRAIQGAAKPAEAPKVSAPESTADRLPPANLVHRFVEVHPARQAEAPAPVPAADLVRQVADQIHRLTVEGKSELSFQLKPETLGRLDVRISVEGGSVTVQLGTQTGEARGMIESNLSQLRSALAEQGLRVDRLVVYVGQNLAGFDTSAQQQRAWSGRPGGRQTRVETLDPIEAQSYWWQSAGRIDCRV